MTATSADVEARHGPGPTCANQRNAGDSDQLLAKLRAYQAMGFEAFILEGYPHVQECELVARHGLPRMQHGPLDI